MSLLSRRGRPLDTEGAALAQETETLVLTLCVGTRPDFIKMGPIAAELRALGTPFRVVNTNQHTDLAAGTPAETDLCDARNLRLASDGHLMRWVHTAQRALSGAFAADDIIVVQGDTMSAYAAAGAAHDKQLPLVHVEAGVRSHALDEPWPEERFRVHIDAEATWRYAATSTAYANLVAEGVPVTRIRVTGNSGVSALARYTTARPSAPSDHAVVTLHRREWTDGPHFVEVLDALATAAADHAAARFLWPMHPTVAKRLSRKWLEQVPPNVLLLRPLPYAEMAGLVATAFGVLTDSGGVTEDAATLGVPCIQLRNFSDRPESIEAGVSRREPATAAGLFNGLQALTTGALPRRPSDAFGDVTAASQVARHLAALDNTSPTE